MTLIKVYNHPVPIINSPPSQYTLTGRYIDGSVEEEPATGIPQSPIGDTQLKCSTTNQIKLIAGINQNQAHPNLLEERAAAKIITQPPPT